MADASDKRSFLRALSTAAIAAPVAAFTSKIIAPDNLQPARHSAFERVQTSRTLRCAYSAYNPMMIIDPNTRSLSGIFYELTNELGKRAGLKVEWVEEVGYGNINTGFQTGRYDAFAAGLWPAGSRSVNTVFSAPLLYDPISVWVRADDTRFDSNIDKLNSADYAIAYTDGDATQNMKNAFFPDAKAIASTQSNSIADEIECVVTRKADAMFRDLITGATYSKQNPGKIKNALGDTSLLMYPLTIGFNENEHGLKTMVDAVIYELQQDGTIARTVQKYLGNDARLFSYADVTYKPFA
jgi:ABC-type amino acid transport substrate-binding protein